MLQADDLELMAHVRNHAAGHLMAVLRLIVFDRLADRQAVLFGDVGEMFFDGFERFQIDHGV